VRQVLAVALKEVRQIVRDPLSLALLLGLPAMMLLLYGYAISFDVRHVPLAVQDRDLTRESRDLVSSFVNSTYFDLAVDAPAGTDIGRLFQERQVKAALVVPEGFGEAVRAGRTAEAQVLIDGSDATTATAVLGYAEAIAAASSVALRPVRGAPAIDFRPRVWFNPELKSSHFLVPGLIGFILMLTAVLSTALSVVREKERGTMEQLAVSPMGPGQLIVGKTIPYLLISLAAAVTIVVAARVLFGVEVRGSYLALLAVTLLYLAGALGLGLLISSVTSSQALAFQGGALLSMLPAIFLSGFIFPLRSMPLPLQVISHLVPARYYLRVVRGIILKGTDLSPYWDQVGFLALYALLVFGVAWVRLTRDAVRP
jgi:ABC-2 type transport system permease protein